MCPVDWPRVMIGSLGFGSGRSPRHFLISGLVGSSNRCGPDEDFDGLS